MPVARLSSQKGTGRPAAYAASLRQAAPAASLRSSVHMTAARLPSQICTRRLCRTTLSELHPQLHSAWLYTCLQPSCQVRFTPASHATDHWGYRGAMPSATALASSSLRRGMATWMEACGSSEEERMQHGR